MELQTPENLVSSIKLNFAEAALVMGCSIASVQLWLSQGKIPSEKDGHRRLFSRLVCEKIKELRAQYGNAWFDHAPWKTEACLAMAPEGSEPEDYNEDPFADDDEDDSDDEPNDDWDDEPSDIEEGEPEAEEKESAAVSLSDENWALFWRMVNKARELHDDNKSDAACELIFALADDFDLI